LKRREKKCRKPTNKERASIQKMHTIRCFLSAAEGMLCLRKETAARKDVRLEAGGQVQENNQYPFNNNIRQKGDLIRYSG